MEQVNSESLGTTIFVGLASISLFADTSRQIMKNLTNDICASVDQTLELLKHTNNSPKTGKLFQVDEEPEFKDEETQVRRIIEEEPVKPRQSELMLKLSAIKVDKEADLRMEQEELAFVESSTLDECWGEAFVVVDPKDNGGRKSIILSARKVPDFLPNLNIDEIPLDELRREYEVNHPEVRRKSSWSDPDVQYEMTDYNSNESSNIDQYSYQWKDSSSKKENQLFHFGPNHFPIGQFDLIPKTQFAPSSAKEFHSPKKQRLYCNNKKVPHWAENDDKVKQRVLNQQSQSKSLRSVAKNPTLSHKLIFPSVREDPRGSSAEWKKINVNKKNADRHMREMEELIQKLHIESLQPKSNVKTKFMGLLKSVKKIWSNDQD